MSKSGDDPEPLFFVLGIDGSHGDVGPPYQDCRVAKEWHLPYKKLHGPSSRKDCEEYIRKNCEPVDPGPLPSADHPSD